ncbi:MAG TPA: S9 family peptidase, partial [Chitinophagaceae bacterium]|nr:S9 family peptidase [Chitinophagaceae bacterium]
MRKLFVFIFTLLLFVTAFAQNGKDPVKVTDLLKIRSAGGISLNRDGSKAVFTVTAIEPEGDTKLEYKYVTQVWMVNTDGTTQPKQLTSKENSTQPVFSPDGKQIAFVRVVDSKPQIFLLSLEGGEAIQFTKYKYGASGPKWSPDGKQILFSATIPIKDLLKDSLLNPGREIPKWPAEKPGFDKNQQLKANMAKPDPDGTMEEIRAYLDNNAADRKAKVVNKLNFLDETDISTDISFNHYFITDVKKEARPVAVTKGFYRFNFAEFTPDGKQLILSGDIDSLENPDRSLESEIFIANADGSGLRMLLGQVGKNYNSPRISPSGKWLAFQYGNTSFVSVASLGVISLNNPSAITDIPFDRSKGNISWSDDEHYIYFSAQSNGGQPVYRANTSTKNVEQLTSYD